MEYKASFTVFESLKKTIEEYKVKIDDMVKNEPDKELANKIQGIFYEGKYGDYTTEGKTSKDDADYEFDRRLNLIRLAQRDRKSFESIINNNINLFHGTNFNALPGMLKYGMLSLKESEDVGNEVNTGEEWSRWRGGKKVLREFISFTDQLNKAIFYSAMPPKDKVKLPSFGIVIICAG